MVHCCRIVPVAVEAEVRRAEACTARRAVRELDEAFNVHAAFKLVEVCFGGAVEGYRHYDMLCCAGGNGYLVVCEVRGDRCVACKVIRGAVNVIYRACADVGRRDRFGRHRLRLNVCADGVSLRARAEVRYVEFYGIYARLGLIVSDLHERTHIVVAAYVSVCCDGLVEAHYARALEAR